MIIANRRRLMGSEHEKTYIQVHSTVKRKDLVVGSMDCLGMSICTWTFCSNALCVSCVGNVFQGKGGVEKHGRRKVKS